MKKFIIILILVFITIVIAASTPLADETYETKYDNIDIDGLMNNERLLKNYIKCLENTGPCTPDAKLLKETLPDAISTDCSKCSEKQKYGADKITHFLIDQRPQDWERLAKTYDPEDSYRQKYLDSKKTETATENLKVDSQKIDKNMTSSLVAKQNQ